VNDRRGLEQGFTLTAPPRGQAAPGQIVIEQALRGSLSAFLTEDRQSILLKDAGGRPVLRYGRLHVEDAVGREVPSRFAVATRKITIEMDAQGAVWPIAVDPLLTSPTWTAESNQAQALLGTMLGTAGDVNGDGFSDVLIGAYNYDNDQQDEGRAFLFLGSSSDGGPGRPAPSSPTP
jgi:hypothetical protein